MTDARELTIVICGTLAFFIASIATIWLSAVAVWLGSGAIIILMIGWVKFCWWMFGGKW